MPTPFMCHDCDSPTMNKWGICDDCIEPTTADEYNKEIYERQEKGSDQERFGQSHKGHRTKTGTNNGMVTTDKREGNDS